MNGKKPSIPDGSGNGEDVTYGAFVLMVTLAWLHVQILRLLSKLRIRD